MSQKSLLEEDSSTRPRSHPRVSSLASNRDHDSDDDYSTAMSKPEVLTLSTIKALFLDPKGLYLVTYAWLFGMCECFALFYCRQVSHVSLSCAAAFWVTFFGGMLDIS